MPASTLRSPTRTDLAVSRALTGLILAFSVGVAAVNLAMPDDTPHEWIADLVTSAAAFTIVISLITLKLRGDFILSLFGPWWPLVLPRSDEMARGARQAAFGFSYLVILNAVLLVALPVTAAAVVSDTVAAGLAALAPEMTLRDALACVLALLMLFAVLPQTYLAWSLKPLDPLDEDALALERAS